MNDAVLGNGETVPAPGRVPVDQVIRGTLRSPVFWIVVAVWATAVTILIVGAQGGPVALRSVIRMTLAAALTGPAGKVRLQTAALLLLAIVPLILALLSDAPAAGTPLSTAAARTGPMRSLGVGWLKLVVLPTAALLALGARWRDLGLARGQRSWRVAALWCGPILAVLALRLATGRLGLARLVRDALAHLIQAGFPEEFFYRGALQTRIALLAGGGWALGLQAVAFAALHWPSAAQRMQGDLLAGLAAAFAMYLPMGLALGVVFERTRSLLAPCLVHVGVNLVSDVL